MSCDSVDVSALRQHAAESDDAWAPFEAIADRLRAERVKRPRDNYDSECCNYVLVNVALYNAATTAADLLKLVCVLSLAYSPFKACISVEYYGKRRLARLLKRYNLHTTALGAFAGRRDEVALTNGVPAFDVAGYRSSEHQAAVGEFLLEVFQRLFGLNYGGSRVGAGRNFWRDYYLHVEARDDARRRGIWR